MAAVGTRSLVISVGGTDYSAQVSTAEVRAADSDSDFVTFADAAAGGSRSYTLHLEMSQDLASSGLWSTIWSAAGTDVAVLLKPYGNATASASQPHYTMSASVREPDGVLLGGEADPSTTARFTVEVDWPLAAKPVKVTS